MGLQEVIQEVRQSGEDEAQELLAAARAEAEHILAEAAADVDDYHTRRMDQVAKDAAQLQEQSASGAEFEARKILLTEEAALRSELRDTVVSGFAALPAASRQKHLKALLAQAKSVIPAGRIWGAGKDQAFLSKAGPYKWAAEADIAGGLIVENSTGSMRLDLSYETILDDNWRTILKAEEGLF